MPDLLPEAVDFGLLLVVVLCAHTPLVARPDYLTYVPNLE